MPVSVRAAVCRAFGEPLTVERVVLDDPGPGEVRVRVGAVAICHSDVSYVDGEWGGDLPAIWGHEAAGIISATGAEVGFEIGQRVVVTLIRSCGECARCQRGAEIACRTNFALDDRSPITDEDGAAVTHGMQTAAFAEEVVVHASQIVPIDDDVPIASASLLACGVITGVGAVLNTAGVEPGSSVVVLGCGGVGLNVVQGAALARAETIIAVDPVPSKLDLAIHLGATDAHELTTPKDLIDVVHELTDGMMADYVFVATGAPSALAGADALVGTMGAIVIVGMPASGISGSFDPGSLAGRNQRILGSKMGTTVIARDIPELVTRYQDGKLELDGLISRTFPLDQINEAMDGVRSGAALRNVVVFETDD
jgi:S-(hydroxymethyl)glutathione dehydrogenase/alcohol dehydrogenase